MFDKHGTKHIFKCIEVYCKDLFLFFYYSIEQYVLSLSDFLTVVKCFVSVLIVLFIRDNYFYENFIHSC